ncbi:Gar1/Naf1 RNA binding region-domain-containing protein [Chytridium lagenaria]|nr:Gar1/Naf1 RNA binding region-domain-containing protein [Chytridium lagenaria]
MANHLAADVAHVLEAIIQDEAKPEAKLLSGDFIIPRKEKELVEEGELGEEGELLPVPLEPEQHQIVEEQDDDSDTDSDFNFSDDGTVAERVAAPSAAKDLDLSDDEGGFSGPGGSRGLKTKNEIDVLPPVEAINIVVPPDAELTEIGTIMAQVEDQLVIESIVGGENKVLDADTVILLEDRSVVGRIFETFGPVLCPMYSIRFNPQNDVDKEKFCVGLKVFFAPSLAKFVFTAQLRALKGSDASNIYDEEVGDDESPHQLPGKAPRQSVSGFEARPRGPHPYSVEHRVSGMRPVSSHIADNRMPNPRSVSSLDHRISTPGPMPSYDQQMPPPRPQRPQDYAYHGNGFAGGMAHPTNFNMPAVISSGTAGHFGGQGQMDMGNISRQIQSQIELQQHRQQMELQQLHQRQQQQLLAAMQVISTGVPLDLNAIMSGSLPNMNHAPMQQHGSWPSNAHGNPSPSMNNPNIFPINHNNNPTAIPHTNSPNQGNSPLISGLYNQYPPARPQWNTR